MWDQRNSVMSDRRSAKWRSAKPTTLVPQVHLFEPKKLLVPKLKKIKSEFDRRIFSYKETVDALVQYLYVKLFSAAQRPLQVARGCRRMCTMVRFRVFCLLWAAKLKRVLATFSRMTPTNYLFFRGWAGMVPPGQPSKPRAQQKFPHRERRIASWGTFCVPQKQRLLGN